MQDQSSSKGNELKTIMFAISGHGFGHLAQVADVIRLIGESMPSINVVIRTALSKQQLTTKLGRNYDHILSSEDFGVRTTNGFDIDYIETNRAYDNLLQNWDAIVESAIKAIAEESPDLIVSNIGFIPILVSKHLGVPAIGMGSLDWYTILSRYLNDEVKKVLNKIDDSYASAAALLELEPCSAAASWQRRIPVGSTASRGRNRSVELHALLKKPLDYDIIICAFGNSVPLPPPTNLFTRPKTVFLVPERWSFIASTVCIDSLKWDFIDLIASSDFCLAKLGYGIATETIRNRVPLLYHRREGWYEDLSLIDWIEANGIAAEINLSYLDASILSTNIERFRKEQINSSPKFVSSQSIIGNILRFLP